MTQRSKVDLPAPLGPSRTVSRPGSSVEVDAVQHVRRAVPGGDAGDGEPPTAGTGCGGTGHDVLPAVGAGWAVGAAGVVAGVAASCGVRTSPRYAAITRGSRLTAAGSPDGDALAGVEDHDPVAQAHDEFGVVLDEDRADPGGAHLLDDLDELVDLAAGQTGDRLVEQQDPRPGDQRPPDLEQPALPGRQRGRLLVQPLAEPEGMRPAGGRGAMLACLAQRMRQPQRVRKVAGLAFGVQRRS